MSDKEAAARLLRNARREMLLILGVTALALVWTVGYCFLHGYQHAPDSWVVQSGLASTRSAEDLQQIAGLPDWVFVGIVLPWLMCTAFSIGVCLGLKDDDLGKEAASTQGAAHGH
ncbi:MAG: hypothetical protein FJ271_18290 [Planctomycetes bacterium]|nr:hypothetical protein [Planctomycetota bacterium]